MQVTRVSKRQEDGSYEVQILLSEEQTTFLIQFALGFLVKQGTISILDVDENGKEITEEEKQLAYLSAVDKDKLPQA